MKEFVVYIMTNKSGTLYTGVTSDVHRRVEQHKAKETKGFTQKYNIDQLVYCEVHQSVHDAIRREKQIKGWRRTKKIALIEESNPKWRDLSDEL
ncbi:MAG: GIY-YIG nuclease family protein [Candidatus Hydrogenedentes bacterium]|nr:GIY-YIG nuclease family protein [Candidatus Hydrogenedentota bacterium]